MLWFGGSIAEAVNLSKQRNAIFVVFIEGNNDLSVEMATMLNDAEITKRLSDEQNFLAIKLASGSTEYTYFAQMYQFVPVPSLFFIGRSGVPLEVVCAGVQASNLAQRIDRILEEHRKTNPITTVHTNVVPSTSSQNIQKQTTSLLESEAKMSETPKVDRGSAEGSEVVKEVLTRPREESSESSPGPAAKVQKTVEYEVVCDGDVCTRVPKVDPGPSSVKAVTPPDTPKPSESAYDAQEEIKKMERAKQLIEIRRREKAEKEKELEKQKELERRTTGQGVAELKRWQEEQEMKNIQEERKREKLENNLARQRVLEQIAQDRAERKARENREAPVSNTPVTPTATTTGDVGTHARLQFKLPDGGSHLAQFPTDATLSSVREHLVHNLQLNKNQFTLWTAFPRRELVEDSSTLRELSLAPSAALLVVGRQGAAVAKTSASPLALFSFLSTLFSTLILDPSYQLYNWLRSRLFPPAAGDVGGGVVGGVRGGVVGSRGVDGGGGAVGGVRRRGNVHRLAGDADDDNNTWNGNSTQQM